jgi:hypothetical protein
MKNLGLYLSSIIIVMIVFCFDKFENTGQFMIALMLALINFTLNEKTSQSQ